MRLEMKHFVLEPRSKCILDVFARASRTAMMAYAQVIKKEHPEFAADLCKWIDREVRQAIEKFHEEP